MRGQWIWACSAVLLGLAAGGKASAQGQATMARANAGLNAATADPTSARTVLAAAAGKISPGQWESTTEIIDMHMSGLPAGMPKGAMNRFKPPKTTTSQCITPEQAANPEAQMLANQKKGQCTVQNFAMAGGKMDVRMSCAGPSGQGKGDVHMAGTYSATRYEMNGTMKAANPNGMVMTMTSHTVGHRTGACTGG